MNSNDRTIAYTILSQLGGNRFCAMIGVSSNSTIPGGLLTAFKARATNKANRVKITLRGDDTYEVMFLRVWGSTTTIISTFENVYAEALVQLFETETGLATHL